MDREKKEFGGWWLFTLGLVVISIIVLATLNYMGIIGTTVVQNQVFKNSYQRKAGLEEANTRYTAELAKINSLLANEKDPNVIKDLKAQKAAIEVLLNQNNTLQQI